MRKLLGTGSSDWGGCVASTAGVGLPSDPWVITSLGSHGPTLMFRRASFVTLTVSGRGWTARARMTRPSGVATMCSPDENWSPSQVPSNHLSEITPPLHRTGHPMHDGGSKRVDFTGVVLASQVLPRSQIPLADLVAI